MENNQNLENLVFPIIIKKSPNSLAIQIALILLFSLVLFLLIIFLGSIISSIIQASWIGVSLATIALIALAFLNITTTVIALLKWNSEYYEIHQNEIVFARGIISEKRRSFPIEKVETMNVSQNFIERTFDYGDITLLNPVLPQNRRLRLINVPQPQKHLELIKGLQENLLGQSPRTGHTIYQQEIENSR